MTNTTTKKRGDRITANQAMITGIQKFLTNLATLPVESQNMAPADIVKVFQSLVDAGQAVQMAEAQRTAAVKADRDLRAKNAAFVQALRRIVLGMFQESPDTLAIFGLVGPKARKVKVAVKATAVAKNKATRAARGTVGKRKKLAIKGTAPTGNGGTPEPATAATSAAPTVAVAGAPATPAKPVA
jgi:hypothetical protein